MIVRIAGEGQFKLDDSEADELNRLDNLVVEAVEAGDEGAYRDGYQRMHRLVHAGGERLPAEEIVSSDVILPPQDLTLAEASVEFSGEGLIPD